MEPRQVIFKANEWQISEENEDEENFYVSGLTKEGKNVVIQVDGFTPFVYVELPLNIDWNKSTIFYLYEYIKENFKCPPLRYKFCKKFNLYFKKPGLYMLLVFKTQYACRCLHYFFEKKHTIPGIGIVNKHVIKVHEQNIDQIIKFTATQNLKLGSWIQATEYIPEGDENLNEEERKFTTADIDMLVHYKSVKPIEVSDTIQPKARIISWDIESYSKNHHAKLPDPTMKENTVTQISVIYCKADDPIEKWKKYLLVLRKGYDIKLDGVKVFHYEKEKDLLLGFTQIIQKLNPDYLLGYNVLKFDWNYLIKRADLLGIYPRFSELGRVIGARANKITKNWESSAYGKQVFEFLECQGRLNIDLMVEIERNHKFDSYSLDSVAENFLGEHKKPVSDLQMFKLTQFADLTRNYHDYEITDQYLKEIKEITDFVFDEEEGITREFYNKINNANNQNIKKRMRNAITIIGDYCIYDSILPLKLLFKLNILYNLEQYANIFCVPKSYLQTRGQQIKGLAQVYRYTLYNNIVIPFKKYSEDDVDEKYQGATVIDAVPGYWSDIATLDFASLYPTVMIANNIDYTTYVDPANDDVPDNECNIIIRDEHRGCIHDPQKRKVSKDKVLCCHHRHKFRKVVEKNGKLLNEGVLPHLLKNLLNERKKIKGEMKELGNKLKNDHTLTKNERNDIELSLIVSDAKQLAVKTSANSIYGMTGAKKGYIPLIPAAGSTTACGRKYIHIAIQYILKNFKSKLVYGDTDSCLIRFLGANTKETFEFAAKAARDTTALFPPPVELEFECVYGKFLLLTKKRYVAYWIDINGNVKYIIKKGIVLKRRDNTHYLKDVYGKLINDVMEKADEKKIFNDLYDNIQKLFTLQIETKNLIIYKAVKDLIDYAKTIELEDPSGATRELANGEFVPIMLKYFLGKDKKPLMSANKKPYVTKNPLDPNLLYDNTSHLMLALKMKARGDDVPPNTRLQYVFLDTGEFVTLQGEKIEDYTYFKENKLRLGLKLDPLYYLEKQLIKPVTEVINVLYRNEKYKYETLETRITNCEKFLFRNMDESIQESILSMKDFIIKTFSGIENKKMVPYANRIRIVRTQVKKFSSIKKIPSQFTNLINLYYTKKSELVLDKLEGIYGIKKRQAKKPDKQGMIVKDGKIMENILKYRTTYCCMIRHLKSLFSDLRFE